MADQKKKIEVKKLDTKEFELPETLFVRDIENRVFQEIVVQCLSKIQGITPVEGTFLDNILGRGSVEGIKGVYIEQDNKNHSVSIKIEVNICFGYSIPNKADEIQTLISEEVTKVTGLHVSCVHVIFKCMIHEDKINEISSLTAPPILANSYVEEEYNDEF